MKNLGILGIIATSFVSLSTAATAGTVTFDYSGYSVASNTNVNIDATLISDSSVKTVGTYGSGQITLYGTTAGQNVAAWCIDAFDDLASSGSYNVIGSGFLNQGVFGTPINTTTLGQIGALVKYGNANVGTPYVSPAVQIAIWDLEYKGLLTSQTPFSSTDPNVNAEVTTLLSDIQNDTLQPYLNLGEVVARGNQGLIFDLAGAPISPVPLPGALPLFGAALAGMAGLRLRKKAENQAA